MTVMLMVAALAAQQVPSAEVAAAVQSEFTAHDLNGDGTLSQAEFGAWMAQLRAKGVARTKADAPETRAWVTAAFTRADADRNAGITEAELTGFLTAGRS